MAAKLNDLYILLGVTGGIAAYKAVDLASKLTAAGARVDCIMTKSAGKLIRPKSFEAITSRSVFTSMWKKPPSACRGPKIRRFDHWICSLIIFMPVLFSDNSGKFCNSPSKILAAITGLGKLFNCEI